MFVFECVYVSLYVLVYLIVFVPWEKQSSWKDTDKAKSTAKRQNERERERERAFVNQLQFNCDFCDEKNLGSHFQVHAHTHKKEQSLEIDADIKIPTGDLGYFYQLR